MQLRDLLFPQLIEHLNFKHTHRNMCFELWKSITPNPFYYRHNIWYNGMYLVFKLIARFNINKAL